jgi:hypothetical protein
MCGTENAAGTWYTCRKCSDIVLCNDCYFDHLVGESEPRTPSRSNRILEELEDVVRPLRKVAKSHFSRNSEILCLLWGYDLPEEWIQGKMNEHEAWEKHKIRLVGLNPVGSPAASFLELIQKGSELASQVTSQVTSSSQTVHKAGQGLAEAGEKTTEGPSKETALRGMKQKFLEHFLEYPPDYEIWRFACLDHDFLEIPALEDISLTRKQCFDSKMQVTCEWLSNLLEQFLSKFGDDTESATIDKHPVEHSHQIQGQSLQTQVDSSKSTEITSGSILSLREDLWAESCFSVKETEEQYTQQTSTMGFESWH